MIFIESQSNASYLLDLKSTTFADGTKKINIINKKSGTISDILYRVKSIPLVWIYEGDSELFDLISYVSAFRDIRSDIKITLYLPYVPYARMDRVELEEDVFTLKYFVNIINSLRFDKVTVLDPHSRVSLALLDRCTEDKASLEKLIAFVLENIKKKDGSKLTIMFPDRGAYERYTSSLCNLFQEFGIDSFIYGEKRRDWKTSTIKSFEIQNLGDKEIQNVLLVDDIFSSGSTMKKCIDSIRPIATGNIYVYCTHTEPASFLESKIEKVLDICDGYYTEISTLLGIMGNESFVRYKEKVNVLKVNSI